LAVIGVRELIKAKPC